MRLKISHQTSYQYQWPASYGLQELRLTPQDSDAQRIVDWQIALRGGRKELQFCDQHQNIVLLIGFLGTGDAISIDCTGEVVTTDTAGIVGRHSGPAPLWYFETSTPLTRAGNLTRHLAAGLTTKFADPVTRLHALSARVLEAIEWVPGHTDANTGAEEALGAGRGVCQDHAHVFIAAARSMGVPARYVSGYLMLTDRIEQDASHAWAEAHVDGIGWIGFDVSNGISPDARYVRVATGLDYRQAAPISGLRIGNRGDETLAVRIQVQQ